MNLHMCGKFGANRSSRLTASTDFWICDPLNPQKCPLGYWGANCIYSMSIPRRIHRRVPNLVPIGPAVWQLPQTFHLWHPNPPPCPWGIVGLIVFSICPFPDESADVYQIWGQSVQQFDSFPRLLNLWHPTPPPPNTTWGIEGRLLFSLCQFPDESADVNESCGQSDSFPRLLICWPPKTPKCPLVSWGAICLAYIQWPYKFAHVC